MVLFAFFMASLSVPGHRVMTTWAAPLTALKRFTSASMIASVLLTDGLKGVYDTCLYALRSTLVFLAYPITARSMMSMPSSSEDRAAMVITSSFVYPENGMLSVTDNL